MCEVTQCKIELLSPRSAGIKDRPILQTPNVVDRHFISVMNPPRSVQNTGMNQSIPYENGDILRSQFQNTRI